MWFYPSNHSNIWYETEGDDHRLLWSTSIGPSCDRYKLVPLLGQGWLGLDGPGHSPNHKTSQVVK